MRRKSRNPEFDRLRARLIECGYTLRSFSAQYGYPYGTVYSAARGTRDGVIARRIRRHLEEVARD